ncbi:hypothetical protein GCM10011504_01960 [Siccirubricoccus deserti]|nr:hypothetical protein GCM10011504_01960 [Siccirubricoccus deserti]
MHGAPGLALACLEAVDAVEPDALGAGRIGLEVGQRRAVAAGVPFLAVGGAGLAADTGVEVDDEAELLLAGGDFGQAGHAELFTE